MPSLQKTGSRSGNKINRPYELTSHDPVSHSLDGVYVFFLRVFKFMHTFFVNRDKDI